MIKDCSNLELRIYTRRKKKKESKYKNIMYMSLIFLHSEVLIEYIKCFSLIKKGNKFRYRKIYNSIGISSVNNG